MKTKILNKLKRLWKETDAQDLTEYALLLVLISLAAVTSTRTLGNTVKNVFSNTATTVASAGTTGGTGTTGTTGFIGTTGVNTAVNGIVSALTGLISAVTGTGF